MLYLSMFYYYFHRMEGMTIFERKRSEKHRQQRENRYYTISCHCTNSDHIFLTKLFSCNVY